ncbi:MAG: aromatic ring-hydroxylating dioxygenase subunit alpha [Alphaproteobacteria bacterium]|nr:aromatic ring-hydroxylating dioxygenase subunit alpha [Alphaproteobacteria bacterium]
MAESLPVAGMTRDHRTSFTLPSPWYYRADVLEREKEAIFFRSWRVVCHGSALVTPGSYVTVDIHGQGIVAIRGRDGHLRAFYNVCQHRAHELLQGSGIVKPAITCPYHGWAYGTDGSLRNARLCDRVPNFDKSDFGLVPVRIQEFAGFIFVNLDDDAPPMNEWAPGFEEECRRWFPDLETVTFGGQKDFSIASNWKVTVENAIEGYHFPNSGPAHRELTDIIDMETTKLHVHDNWLAIIAPPGKNQPEVYPFPRSGPGGQTDHFITLYLWPDWIIYSWPHADMISTYLTRATGAQSSVVENAYFHVPGRGDDETTRASEAWFNETLGPEDAALNEGVQRGIVSRGYHQGRFISRDGEPGDSEHCVHAFQTWVREALDGDVTS